MPSKEKKQDKRRTDTGTETMLQKWRKKPFLYTGVFILLFITVVVFVISPVLSNSAMPRNTAVFGSYNGEPIEYMPGTYFFSQADTIKRRLEASGEQSADSDQNTFRIFRGAFEETVVHLGILDAADESGMIVTNSRLNDYLYTYPAYQENGVFSEDAYSKTSRGDRYRIAKYSRESIIHQQYFSDVLYGTLSAPAEMEFIKSMITPERKVKYAYYSIEDYPENQVIAFAENNPALFDQMKLSRITVTANERIARDIHKKATAPGADFAEIAKASSKDAFAGKGGSMDYRYYYEMLEQFTSDEDTDTVFALERGQVSPVIKVNDTWVIYRADEERTAPDLTDPETISDIRSYMMIREKGTIEDYLVKKLEGFKTSFTGGDMIRAAAAYGLKTGITDFFPINKGPMMNGYFVKKVLPEGSTEQNPVLEAVTLSDQFFTRVFSLEKNDLTDPIIANDYLLIAQLSDMQNASAADIEGIAMFPYLEQQYQQRALYTSFLSSPKLKDDFYGVYFGNNR